MNAPDWMESANCRGAEPAVFFDDEPAAARKICAGCPVTGECLGYAVKNDVTHGIWGGLSATERRKMRRAA